LEGEIMTIVTVGIDLAKNVFAVHGVDETGKPVLVRPEVPRAKLMEHIANVPPCLIGMEACSGAHHWAREFAKFGHTVRMMAPKFVVPYRMRGKRGKNDAADAAAICEAVTRPHMRFVPVKSISQQSQLFVHRARQGYVQQRTALINRIRGLLSELGIVLPLKAATVRREAHKHLEDLPGWCNTVVGDMLSESWVARQCCQRPRTRRIRLAVGPSACRRDGVTGRLWSPLRPRMRVCVGPCCSKARPSRCLRSQRIEVVDVTV
jgi:transposase